jgi:quercetin dioxygenase-like cupin family protein
LSNTFTTFTIETGLLLDLSGEEHPARVLGCAGGTITLPGNETHFILVAAGEAIVEAPGLPEVRLLAGMFAVEPGQCRVQAGDGRALVISRPGCRGLRQAGGPVEARGRLRYIDGCSDTLLVCPPRLGEPCLNHLHIPPGVRQTPHTHPSARIGIIAGGGGRCVAADGSFALRPGIGWYIPAGCVHAFLTEAECLDVIAWHPDSDFGPTDEDHPMLNRTVIRVGRA